jgi:tetratricopeptide (TPR) repeat protein
MVRVFDWLKVRFAAFAKISRRIVPDPHKKMSGLLLQFGQLTAEQIRQHGDSLKPGDYAAFPSVAALLRVHCALSTFATRDPVALASDIAVLERLRQDPVRGWDDESAARAAGLVIERLAAGAPSEQQLHIALEVLADFRRHSSALIPEAFPLIVEAARQPILSRTAALAYVEYCACAPTPTAQPPLPLSRPSAPRLGTAQYSSHPPAVSDSDEHKPGVWTWSTSRRLHRIESPDSAELPSLGDPQVASDSPLAIKAKPPPAPPCSPRSNEEIVHEALRSACRIELPDAEHLNQVVKQACRFDWAVVNLSRLYLGLGKFEAARQEFREAFGPDTFPADAQMLHLGGLIYRGLGEWSQAALYFEKARLSQKPGAVDLLNSATYQIEARLNELDQDLRRGLRGTDQTAAITGEWENRAGVLEEILARRRQESHCPPDATEFSLANMEAMLLRLTRRLYSPTAGWERIAALNTTASTCAELQAEIAAFIFDCGGPMADDLVADSLDGSIESVRMGRWLLRQGRIAKVHELTQGKLNNGLSRDATSLLLLKADLQVRVGETEQAAETLQRVEWAQTNFFDIFHELRIEIALAARDAVCARDLLGRPESLLCSGAQRAVYAAEAAAVAGDWRTAQTEMEKLLAEAPYLVGGLVSFGLQALMQGLDADAAMMLGRAISLEKQNHVARMGQALAEGTWPEVAPALAKQEPAIVALCRPLAKKLELAGRHDLADQLRQQPKG